LNLKDEQKIFLEVIENCPLDCLADPNKKKVPSPEDQRRYLKSEFNQLFYKLRKQNASRFPYESLPEDFRWNLCTARLRLGHFDNWDGWEFRGNFAATFLHNNYPTPKWNGNPITQEHGLKIVGEQGVGDEILFLSALPDLIYRLGPKSIEVQCYPRLIPIIERSLKVKCVERTKTLHDVKGEYMMLMGDLLRWYRKDKSHFPKKPYLKADPERASYWKSELEKLGPKKKIGIAWKSRHGALNPQDLMTEDGIYVNLQYGESPTGLFHFDQDPLTDLEGHFALVAALDKVVSVTQTVVHVAGSLGKECHAIIPPQGTGEVDSRLWYYSTGGQSPVYGSVQIYTGIDDYRARYFK
jgi:hypothetical protein